ncbi:hypothetical protein QBC33DRAFT_582249 [Phialemonium atrogriseum]|uniref:Uncharacterized protein n=1 Tax=Phialemonium atrogriseum TaxID=1093897 RepID=A0AAJ0BR70_9PEZI|nr:uncharacterized protein QBC33DRAFT_582249 [Phialemonium atrogriseum]KAK1761629.1 hypothetical protein QBC33DRAFT_582249 [Phialemonium atrogriseum]
MPPSHYENRVVDCQANVDFGKVAGKTVVLTGGSSGLGLAYIQALVKAGAFVVNGDIQPPREHLSTDRAVFVKCDVTNWEEQVNVFKVAREKAPNGRIDVVIANAGIYGPDALDGLDDPEPKKPATKLLDVNLIGVIYTSKLAGWYFHHQDEGDCCLILISSIMGYIDTQGSSVYSAAKHGVRGLMACLRRKGLVRVNSVAPWFIATPILPESFIKSTGGQFEAMGVDFATEDDAVTAVVRLMTDTSINGRNLGIVPRQLSLSGYLDLERDDFDEGTPLNKLQTVASSLVYGEFGASST